MTIEEIRKLEWIPYTRWEEMKGLKEEDQICRKTIEIFVEKIIKDVSRQVNIDFLEFEKFFKEENSAFFQALKVAYKDTNWFGNVNKVLIGVENLLRVPHLKTDTVGGLVERFNSLSKLEKIEFLSRIEKISITIKYKK